MKNGSLLLTSWLQDVKKCQITLSNWNVMSRSWELHNKDLIEEVMFSTKNFFYEKYNYNIFKDSTLSSQFLTTGDIDVLGIEINSDSIVNIYGINSDFEEKNIEVEDFTITIERIILDLIKTSMLIYGYYNLSKGTIIFVKPNLNTSLINPLNEAIKFLYEAYKLFGLHFNFIMVVNEDYSVHINNNVSKKIGAKRKNAKLKVEETSLPAPSKLREYLEKSGIEIIDKRSKGGALWLLGGEELEPFINDLTNTESITFKFAINGSKSTKNMPAWFTKSNK
jgi:hypothetical protein